MKACDYSDFIDLWSSLSAHASIVSYCLVHFKAGAIAQVVSLPTLPVQWPRPWNAPGSNSCFYLASWAFAQGEFLNSRTLLIIGVELSSSRSKIAIHWSWSYPEVHTNNAFLRDWTIILLRFVDMLFQNLKFIAAPFQVWGYGWGSVVTDTIKVKASSLKWSNLLFMILLVSLSIWSLKLKVLKFSY
jgi:hypothetical protein